MKYRIHYAELNNVGDILCLQFDDVDQVLSFIDKIVYPLKKITDKVYLIAIGEEIIVTDDGVIIDQTFSHPWCEFYCTYDSGDIYIQEYPSYEDAYKVALMMRETSHLCYNKENNII